MSFEVERRAVRVSSPIEAAIEARGATFEARIEDISETGVYAGTLTPLPVGESVTLTFALPGETGESPIRCKASVVWTEANAGMALRFEELGDEERERVKFFVADAFFGKA